MVVRLIKGKKMIFSRFIIEKRGSSQSEGQLGIEPVRPLVRNLGASRRREQRRSFRR